jgi:peptidoglycan/xylan/chitin deacetylase (PgdA/CDA1 family)
MYHDVFAPHQQESDTGFNIPGADLYKLSLATFEQHLDALAECDDLAITTIDQLSEQTNDRKNVLLTFDDGGVSAFDPIATALEQRGWRGHFFVTTDRIGTSGFLDADQIRSLHSRGHIIGSHSASHPTNISALSQDEIANEWSRSCDVLENIIGSPIRHASVPGGFISRTVIEEAARSRIKILFSSQPEIAVRVVDGIDVRGRFTVKRTTKTRTVIKLSMQHPSATLAQTFSWNGRKILKASLGPLYGSIRNRLLRKKGGENSL